MNKREFHKKLRHTKGIFCALSFAVIFTLHFSHAVVINFDDRPGFKGTSVQDQPIPASYVVHDEYLPLGVRFDSGGGGIAIVYAINAVSPTNVALATEPGPVLSFNLPVTATFFSNGAPAVVDMVALTLTSSSGNCRLKAFDQYGVQLGSISAGAGSTLQLSYLNQIHSVELDQGSISFDNFTFTGLTALVVPEVTLNIDNYGTNIVLSWTQGTLQEADAPDGTFNDVSGANSPYPVTPSEAMKFYRVRVR